MTKEYYQMKYQENVKAILEIVLYAVLGAVIAFGLFGTIYSETGCMEKITDYLPCFMLVPMPYGIAKTWRSCLIFTLASPAMWILWIVYIAIKLTIAIMYGLFAMPVMLVISIISAIDNKNRMKAAPSIMMQENTYYNLNPQPYQVYNPQPLQQYQVYNPQPLQQDSTYYQRFDN